MKIFQNIISNIDFYLALFIFFIITIQLIMFLIEKGSTSDVNAVYNKWTKKTLWIWLPFYALRRLIREMIFKMKR